MSKFTDYIDGFADKTSTLAKDELKELIISAKKDESEFVRLQAANVECWTVMLATGELTPLEKADDPVGGYYHTFTDWKRCNFANIGELVL
jgi:uncharacterized protein YbaA (DUF1428 family)